MRVVQCALLAVTAAFLAVEKGQVGATTSSMTIAPDLELFPYVEALSEGDSVIIVQHGPFTVSASCDSTAVSDNIQLLSIRQKCKNKCSALYQF